MVVGSWLVFTEVNNSPKILLLSSVIKEDINFWENDLFEDEEYIDSSWRNFNPISHGGGGGGGGLKVPPMINW